MKPLGLVIALVVISLSSAAPAVAMRTSGPSPNTSSSNPDTAAAAELAAYVAAVQPAYEELAGCACTCNTLDLPSHRCGACRTVAADLKQVVARISRIQGELVRLEVPASLVPAHSKLIAALATMRVSSKYMAVKVLTAPQALVVVTHTGHPSGFGPFVGRPAPTIVRDALIAEVVSTVPAGVDRRQFLRQRYGRANCTAIDSLGTPGEQATALLAQWRDDVAVRAQVAGVSLPTSLA
jgi:hypothetical protein